MLKKTRIFIFIKKEEQDRLTYETKEMEDNILAVLMTIEVKDPVVFYMALLNILMIVGETVKTPEVVQKRISIHTLM